MAREQGRTLPCLVTWSLCWQCPGKSHTVQHPGAIGTATRTTRRVPSPAAFASQEWPFGQQAPNPEASQPVNRSKVRHVPACATVLESPASGVSSVAWAGRMQSAVRASLRQKHVQRRSGSCRSLCGLGRLLGGMILPEQAEVCKPGKPQSFKVCSLKNQSRRVKVGLPCHAS